MITIFNRSIPYKYIMMPFYFFCKEKKYIYNKQILYSQLDGYRWIFWCDIYYHKH